MRTGGSDRAQQNDLFNAASPSQLRFPMKVLSSFLAALSLTALVSAADNQSTTDVRINNLINYNDAISVGTTNYTNTLTYTVVSQ